LGLLDQINSPRDLEKLSLEDLTALAEEIRQEMINVVSVNGGHLASNLGVVELTIALHRVFNCPQDKIVWDVGHQSYVHKLLTERRDQFHTIRQLHGLAGFPKREESEYDCFNTGHSSTSISSAYGFAKARDLAKEDYSVIAVIGDGAMSGGMAYEALNDAGNSDSNLIVVLNDNEMFISSNVGAMSTYLNKIRTAPIYDKKKKDLENFLKSIPAIGTKVAKAAEKTGLNIFWFRESYLRNWGLLISDRSTAMIFRPWKKSSGKPNRKKVRCLSMWSPVKVKVMNRPEKIRIFSTGSGRFARRREKSSRKLARLLIPKFSAKQSAN